MKCKEKKKINTIKLKEQEELEKQNEKLNQINFVIQQNSELKSELDKLKKKVFNSDKIIKKHSDSIQLVKIDKSIQELKTDIPANVNLKLSTHLIDKLVQKDICIEKLKMSDSNVNLIKQDNYFNEYFDEHIIDNNRNKFKGKILLIGDKGEVLHDNCANKFEKSVFDNKENNLDIDIQYKNISNHLLNNQTFNLTLNGNKINIEYRESDGFVNATQLCKAGGKKFNDWYRLDTTKQLILKKIQ